MASSQQRHSVLIQVPPMSIYNSRLQDQQLPRSQAARRWYLSERFWMPFILTIEPACFSFFCCKDKVLFPSLPLPSIVPGIHLLTCSGPWVGGTETLTYFMLFQAAMEAEYAALRLAPNSREVELRLRQLKDEAAALQ